MLKISKIFIIFLIISLFIISPVFATDVTAAPTENLTKEQNSTSLIPSDVTKEDLFFNDITNNYTIDNILYGNAFILSSDFTLTSKNKGGIIYGDLFASTTNTTIQSDLIYSNEKDKSGNYMIDQVKSYSVVKGNVYVVAKNNFTLESNCEIHGDLYVFADNINIATNAVITGNVFAFANSSFTLNGKVSGSVYVSASQCNISYTGHIARDLLLNVSDSANISGKVARTAKLNSDLGKIVTTSDFVTEKDLFAEANTFDFAGEVQGDAKISAKNLSFNNSKTCIIRGKLDYATKSDLQIPDKIIVGEVNSFKYVDKYSFSYQVASKLVSYVAFLIYVFVITLIFKYIAPNFIESLSQITTTNIFVGLGVGFGLLLAFLPVFLLLIITNFTISLGLTLLLSVIFIAVISIPLFILAISNAWKSEKVNLYLRLLIVSTIVFIINLIPRIGMFITSIFTIIAIGKILTALFYRKK